MLFRSLRHRCWVHQRDGRERRGHVQLRHVPRALQPHHRPRPGRVAVRPMLEPSRVAAEERKQGKKRGQAMMNWPKTHAAGTTYTTWRHRERERKGAYQVWIELAYLLCCCLTSSSTVQSVQPCASADEHHRAIILSAGEGGSGNRRKL